MKFQPQIRMFCRIWSDPRSETGSSLVEMGLLLPVLFLLLLGAVDFGRAYYLAIEVSNAAHTGALYGAQNPTDTSGMQGAATSDAPDVPGFAVTATYGCECSNGASAVAACGVSPSLPNQCGRLCTGNHLGDLQRHTPLSGDSIAAHAAWQRQNAGGTIARGMPEAHGEICNRETETGDLLSRC